MPRTPTVPGAPGGSVGSKVEHAVHLLDDDLALAHRFGRHQAEILDAAIAVGENVDGRSERRHRERGIGEWVLHDVSPKSGGGSDEDATRFELSDRGGFLGGSGGDRPDQRVAGDDGVAGD